MTHYFDTRDLDIDEPEDEQLTEYLEHVHLRRERRNRRNSRHIGDKSLPAVISAHFNGAEATKPEIKRYAK